MLEGFKKDEKKRANEKGFERVKEFVISRFKWFAGVAIGSFFTHRWLPLLTLPATLAIWNSRDKKIADHYAGFRSGEDRDYQKCTQDQLEAFMLGVAASESYLVQFRTNFPGTKAGAHPDCYYAGLGAYSEADDELIGMVKANLKVPK